MSDIPPQPGDLDKALGAGEPPPVAQRPPTQSADRLAAKTDGRACKICGCKDSDRDPLALSLQLDELYWWGYPPSNGCTHGGFCGYCVKVWAAKYKIQKSVSLTGLVVLFRTDTGLKTAFIGQKDQMVVFMCGCGTRGNPVPWNDIDQELTKIKSHKLVFQAPTDNGMELDDYVPLHGDPSKNGKGHTVQKIEGKTLVVIPGPRMYKIKRLTEDTIQSSRSLGNTNTAASSSSGVPAASHQELTDMLSEMRGAMFGSVQATGMNMDELMPRFPAPSPPPQQPPAPGPQDADPDEELFGQGVDVGLAVSRVEGPPRAQAVRPHAGGAQVQQLGPAPGAGQGAQAAQMGGRQAGEGVGEHQAAQGVAQAFNSRAAKAGAGGGGESEDSDGAPLMLPPPAPPGGRGRGRGAASGRSRKQTRAAAADGAPEDGAAAGEPPPQKRPRAGRTPRNLSVVTSRTVEEFKMAGDDSKAWYGDHWGTNKTVINRLKQDIKVRISKTDATDTEELERLSASEKILEALVQGLTSWHTHGKMSAEWCESLDAQIHFCTKPPVVEHPFPLSWILERTEAKLMLVANPEEFWALCDHRDIMQFDGPAVMLERVLIDRMTRLTKSTAGEGELPAWMQAYPSHRKGTPENCFARVPQSIHEQCRAILCIVYHTTCLPADVETALGMCTSELNRHLGIAQTLSHHPRGRTWIASARSHMQAKQVAMEKSADVLVSLDVLSEASAAVAEARRAAAHVDEAATQALEKAVAVMEPKFTELKQYIGLDAQGPVLSGIVRETESTLVATFKGLLRNGFDFAVDGVFAVISGDCEDNDVALTVSDESAGSPGVQAIAKFSALILDNTDGLKHVFDAALAREQDAIDAKQKAFEQKQQELAAAGEPTGAAEEAPAPQADAAQDAPPLQVDSAQKLQDLQGELTAAKKDAMNTWLMATQDAINLLTFLRGLPTQKTFDVGRAEAMEMLKVLNDLAVTLLHPDIENANCVGNRRWIALLQRLPKDDLVTNVFKLAKGVTLKLLPEQPRLITALAPFFASGFKGMKGDSVLEQLSGIRGCFVYPLKFARDIQNDTFALQLTVISLMADLMYYTCQADTFHRDGRQRQEYIIAVDSPLFRILKPLRQAQDVLVKRHSSIMNGEPGIVEDCASLSPIEYFPDMEASVQQLLKVSHGVLDFYAATASNELETIRKGMCDAKLVDDDGNEVDWENQFDRILHPDNKDLVAQVYKFKNWRKCATLVNMADERLKGIKHLVMDNLGPFVASDALEACSKQRDSAVRLVSLVYVLNVLFDKIFKEKNVEARKSLIKELRSTMQAKRQIMPESVSLKLTSCEDAEWELQADLAAAPQTCKEEVSEPAGGAGEAEVAV